MGPGHPFRCAIGSPIEIPMYYQHYPSDPTCCRCHPHWVYLSRGPRAARPCAEVEHAARQGAQGIQRRGCDAAAACRRPRCQAPGLLGRREHLVAVAAALSERPLSSAVFDPVFSFGVFVLRPRFLLGVFGLRPGPRVRLCVRW